MNNLKDIHNLVALWLGQCVLFCQDVNEQFEGYTQHTPAAVNTAQSCFVRMSMNNLKDIHNLAMTMRLLSMLFCQDVNEQFEGYTQQFLRDIVL